PARKLLAQFLVGIVGKAAAAIDRHLLAAHSEQPRQCDTQEFCLYIPQRRIDSRNGARRKPGTPEVANRTLHGHPAAGNIEAVRTLDRLGQQSSNQGSDGGIRVGVSHTLLTTRLHMYDDERGGVPPESAVRLRPVGWNTIGRCLHLPDRRAARPLTHCRDETYPAAATRALVGRFP